MLLIHRVVRTRLSGRELSVHVFFDDPTERYRISETLVDSNGQTFRFSGIEHVRWAVPPPDPIPVVIHVRPLAPTPADAEPVGTLKKLPKPGSLGAGQARSPVQS